VEMAVRQYLRITGPEYNPTEGSNAGSWWDIIYWFSREVSWKRMIILWYMWPACTVVITSCLMLMIREPDFFTKLSRLALLAHYAMDYPNLSTKWCLLYDACHSIHLRLLLFHITAWHITVRLWTLFFVDSE
jgi:hypothetical protein